MNTSKILETIGRLNGKEISIIFLAGFILSIVIENSSSFFGIMMEYVATVMLVFVYFIWPLALTAGMQSAVWKFRFELESAALIFVIVVSIGRLVVETVTSINTNIYFDNTILAAAYLLSMLVGWSSLSDLFIGQRDNIYYRLTAMVKLLFVVSIPPIGAFILRGQLDKYRLAKGWNSGPLVSDAILADDAEAVNHSSTSTGERTEGSAYGPRKK